MARRQLRWADHLHATPVRNASVTVVSQDADEILLEIQLVYSGWRAALAKAFNARRRKRIALDGIGRDVYESIDGRSTFEQLIDAFASEHCLTFLESRALLAQFISQLMERGLVAISVPRDTTTPGDAN